LQMKQLTRDSSPNIGTSHGILYKKKKKKQNNNNNNNKTKSPVKKWTKDLNRYFSKEDTDGQKIHEKILNITVY